jgi:hypothetical protein
MGGVEVEEGSSSGIFFSLSMGPESPHRSRDWGGGADGEADEWGGSRGSAASGRSGAAAAYSGGLVSESKFIKDGWEVGFSCRIGFLRELTGVGAFPNTASIVGWSVAVSWANGRSQEGGSSIKVCHIRM